MKTKIDKKVMMMAAGLGGAVSLVLGILSIAAIYIPFLICVTGPIACIIGYAVPVVAGVYAVKKHGINKDNLVDGLIIGGLAGLAAGAVAGVVSIVVGLISIPLTSAAYSSSLSVSSSSLLNGGVTVVGVIIGAVIATVVDTIIGGISGLIMAAVTQGKGTPAK
jgi:hypothetical protein